MLRVREARACSFPPELFDEHGWIILLHLFSALAENERVSEAELMRRAGCTPRVGRAWLAHLVAKEQIVAREEGADVEMTAAAIDGMRSVLDVALQVHAETLDG